ncbi:basic blue protein [Arachis duranensis]|uniref:Basic blue protein n=1 Tax=Arachis duranensis TaxID=130453 RepID=A0A6P4C4B3_ARADU|nr:basic blue protein [Arachis duranensis]XP_057738160.1 basic blue protein-like [Arachis stenosperma]
MGDGRRSSAMIGVMLLLCMSVTYALRYKVGDSRGWSFNVSNWPYGKTFMAGDVLEFNYMFGMHNVMEVDKSFFELCIPIPKIGSEFGDTVHWSGNDQIQLRSGQSYFICSFLGHCQRGMKIAVNAV